VLNEGPEDFCDRLRTRLVGAMVLACGDHAVGEDLAQDALIRAWQRWDEVRELQSPDDWVFRVAFNLSNSWHRRRMAEWRANRRSQAGADDRDGEVDRAAIVAIRAAVAGLPPRQRSVIVARYYLGYDVAGTAALLDCAEGTVKATTHQALANLRASGLTEDAEEREVLR
jgi:RNA polymerase sigma factor (sigma-70 family)